jgi:putative phage-type endonuclease
MPPRGCAPLAREAGGSMSARLIPTSSEEEWLAARRLGITASEIAVLMGLSPYSSPFALFHRKTGALPAEEDKAVFERGHVLEPYIAEKFSQRRPEFVVAGDGRELYAHQDRPWQLATPDRLVWERDNDRFWPGGDYQNLPDAVLETKTDAGGDWGDEGSDDIPVHYRCQVLWQMDVMGVTTGFVACLMVRPWKIRVYELTLDGAARIDLKVMRNEAREFLDRIDLGDPPDVDWRPATGEALRRLHPSVVDKDIPIGPALRIQYQAAVRRYGEAKQRKALLTNRVLDAIGDGRRAVATGPGGEVIATRSASEPKRVNADQLRAEYPAAAAACTHGPEHPEIKLTPKPPKDKPKETGALPASEYDGTSYDSDPVSDLLAALPAKPPKEKP